MMDMRHPNPKHINDTQNNISIIDHLSWKTWPNPNFYPHPNNNTNNLPNPCRPPTVREKEILFHPFAAKNKEEEEEKAAEEVEEDLGAMKEMMFKMAAMQPVDIDPATVQRPQRRNVRISHDPQSMAARHRRERISLKMRILQRLVPGGTKMDTASMLEEAVRYLKFLKRQIRFLEAQAQAPTYGGDGVVNCDAAGGGGIPHVF